MGTFQDKDSSRRKGAIARQLSDRREPPSAARDTTGGAVGSTQFLSARSVDLSTGKLPGMPEAIHMSSAAYAASTPFRDAVIQEVNSKHLRRI